MDPDDELQAYLNQLDKRAHVLQNEEVSSSIPDLSLPSSLSSPIPIKPKNIKNDSIKDVTKEDKFKLLQEKYLKKKPKVKKISNSSSPEFFEDLIDTDSQKSLFDQGRKNDLFFAEPHSPVKKFEKDETSLKYSKDTNEKQENESIFYSSNQSATRRKSSTGSILLNKDGVFYSSSISTDNKPRYQRQNSIIKFAKYDLTNSLSDQSDSIATEKTESVEEEIIEIARSREGSRRSSRISSLIMQETDGQKESVGTRERKNSERETRQRKGSEKDADTKQRKNTKSSLRNNKEEIRLREKESETEDVKRERKSSKKKSNNGTKTKTNRRRHKLKESSSSSLLSSSTASLSSSSSSSSSFSIKIKRKKRKKKKREKEMTELFIKILLKNLPFVIRESVGCKNAASEPFNFVPPHLNISHFQSDSTQWQITNRRIDDALRQTVDLTQQFLDTHRTFVEANTQHRNNKYVYTFLKEQK